MRVSVCRVGGKVSASKPLAIDASDEAHLHVTRAALAPSSSSTSTSTSSSSPSTPGKKGMSVATVLSVTIGGESFVVGTLREGVVEQMELSLPVHAASGKTYYLTVEGPGLVHVTGVYEAALPDDDDEDDYDDYDDDALFDDDSAQEEEEDEEEEEEEGPSVQVEEQSSDAEDPAPLPPKKTHQQPPKQLAPPPPPQPQPHQGNKKRAEPEGGKTTAERSAKKAKATDSATKSDTKPKTKEPSDKTTWTCTACNKHFYSDKALASHTLAKHS